MIKDGKIGYIEQDEVSFNINYGYKTLFAYYLAFEEKKIPRKHLDDMKSISVKLGSFSLAEIPKIGFKSILGVTGTLRTLSEKQNKIISDEYGIKLETIMPSIYGERKLKFDPSTDTKQIVIKKEEFFLEGILDEIKSRMKGRDGESRAIFVFFETRKDLYEFKNFENFNDYCLRNNIMVKILTEEANDMEKKNIITNAAISNQIVLFTKVFGRGTDFITHDELVRKSGIHVLQAFFSDEKSEETQIQGN